DVCFICRGLASGDDRDSLIVLRTSLSVVLLNRFPYNNGHLLVAPKAHKGDLAALDATELLETMETLRRMVASLSELIHPDGYTNFMPVLADTKVIAQSLESLYDLLVTQMQKVSK